MAYLNTNIYHSNPTRVLCDGCAASEVPFEGGQQAAPWTWHPVYGASCNGCGKRC